MLTVRFFGSLELKKGSSVMPLPRAASSRSLLAYLLFYNDRPHARAKLAGTFWPELPEKQARQALRRALWEARQAMGEGWIQSTRDKVWVEEPHPVWRDVSEFEDALRAGSLERLSAALELYRGRFLEGIYDDWVLLESDRLHEAYLSALQQLIALNKNIGDYEAALNHARALVAADPLRESAHREIMRFYHLLGRPEAAIRQFEACRRILHRELAVEPEPETVALVREIARRGGVEAPVDLLDSRAESTPYALTTERQMPLIGREAERSALVQHMREAFEGRGHIVLLGGEAGVGKSRLLQAVTSHAEWHDAIVLWGRSLALDQGAPYRALQEALAPLFTAPFLQKIAAHIDPLWLSAAAPLFPEASEAVAELPPLPSLEGEHAKTRLLEALTQIILGASRWRPLLLLLEDLHWGDPGTLEALSYLASRLSGERVLLLGSYRLSEAATSSSAFGAWLAQWAPRPEVDILLLERLTLAEAELFIRRGLGLKRSAPLFTARLYKETGGNPFFLLETLRALHDSGLLVQDAQGNWSTPWDESTQDYSELPLSPEVERVVLQRLALLSDAANQVLRVAAVLGEAFSFSLLRRVSPLDQSVTLRALNEVLRHRLLEKAEAGYRFGHNTVRAAVYATISSNERRLIHRRAAQALEAIGQGEASVLAHHYILGGLPEKAAAYFLEAGKHALALYALPLAQRHFSRAMELEEALTPAQRFDLYRAYEGLLDLTGDQGPRASVLERMVNLAEASDNAAWKRHALLSRARYLAQTSAFDEAEQQAQQALQVARANGDLKAKAAALNLLGWIANWRGGPRRSPPLLQQAVAICQQCGDLAGEAAAHNALANALLGVKAYVAAREHGEMALTLSEALDDRPGQADALSMLGIIAMEQGDTEAAKAYYLRALELSREIGYRYSEARALVNLGNIDFVGGRLSQALQRYEQGMRIFQAIGQERGTAMLAANTGGVWAGTVGDLERGESLTQEALAYYRRVGDHQGVGLCLAVLGQIAHCREENSTARAYLEESIALLRGAGEAWMEVQARMVLVPVLVAVGEPQEALAVIEEAEALCRQHKMDDLLTAVLAYAGYIWSHLGDHERAFHLSSQAVARMSEGVAEAHVIYYYHYLIARAHGRMEEAYAALQQAVQQLEMMLAGLSAEQQAMSRTRVPEHRAILAAWEAFQPRQERVRLPRADAPTGRPLRDEEYVEVVWTIATPEDEAIPKKTARRRARLLRLLQEAAAQGAAPTQAHLARALGVGVRTIARDMAALRQEGYPLPETR